MNDALPIFNSRAMSFEEQVGAACMCFYFIRTAHCRLVPRPRAASPALPSCRLIPPCPKVSALRIILADILEEQEQWREAAQVLIAVPLESGHR